MKSKCLTFVLAVALGCVGAWAADPGACVACHEGIAMGALGQSHMRLEPFEVMGHSVGCLGCHDAGKTDAHVDSGDVEAIRAFGKDEAVDNAACMSCHATKGMGEWAASRHAGEDLACTTCHKVHKASRPQDTCAGCHASVAASFRLPSRHPVEAGKMSCASCHDVHASTEAALKVKTRKNDLCLSCHPAQEGPFIFEHSPVNEDCNLCHSPHGSVANNLLVANEPALCLQCHEFHFQANHEGQPSGPQTIGGRVFRNPYGEYGMNRAMTTKCTTCHPRVHGTDLPSQGVPTSGWGLTR